MTSMLLIDRYAAAAASARTAGAGMFMAAVVACACRWGAGARGQYGVLSPQPSPAAGRSAVGRTAPESGPGCSAPDHDSLPQSRGVMPFSFAYFAADSSTISRTSFLSGWIQSVM